MGDTGKKVRNVAIIGGGLSGLACAYHFKQRRVGFKLFEPVHHMGGNMRTWRGLEFDGVKRWVDLGVNDFSKTGYVNLVRVMKRLGVKYKPLEDSSSYSTIQAGVAPDKVKTGYTVDNAWEIPPSKAIQEGIIKFREFCEKHIKQLLDDPSPTYKYMTVGQFLDWAKLNEEFVCDNFFPRILGMYFTGGVPPRDLPIRMIIHYYYLQEGLGRKPAPNPERQYWVDGCRSFVKALCDYADPGKKKGVLLNDADPTFTTRADGHIDVTCNGTTETFDALVMARQAWQVMDHFATPSQAPAGLADTLGRFTFSSDQTVVHTATSVLPPDVNAWGTYNLNIPPTYDQENLGYTMTYWCNRHQNDPKNPKYNWRNRKFRATNFSPDYFNTINPKNPIPDAAILAPKPDSMAAGCGMFQFNHNVMNMDAFKAQEAMDAFQGKANIWYVGGYTIGAGLQEECWNGAIEAAKKVLDHRHVDASRYRLLKDGRWAMPEYMQHLMFGP